MVFGGGDGDSTSTWAVECSDFSRWSSGILEDKSVERKADGGGQFVKLKEDILRVLSRFYEGCSYDILN